MGLPSVDTPNPPFLNVSALQKANTYQLVQLYYPLYGPVTNSFTNVNFTNNILSLNFQTPTGVPPYQIGNVVSVNQTGSPSANSFVGDVITCSTTSVTLNIHSYQGVNTGNWTLCLYPFLQTSNNTIDLISNTIGQTFIFNFENSAPFPPYSNNDCIRFVSGPDTYWFTANVIGCTTTGVEFQPIVTSSTSAIGISPWTINAQHPNTKFKSRDNTWYLAKLSGQPLTAMSIAAEYSFAGQFQLFLDYYGLAITQLSQLNEYIPPGSSNASPDIRFSDFYGLTNDYFPYIIDPAAFPPSTSQSLSQFIASPTSNFTLLQSGWVQGNVIPQAQQSAYTNAVGAALIDSVDFRIGGQTIETLTGEYIQNKLDMSTPLENKPALTILIGKDDGSAVYSPRVYYVNLPFYFYREPGQAVPLIALARQQVELAFNFNYIGSNAKNGQLAVNIQPFVPIASPFLQATLLCEYAYLTTPELNFFKNRRINYLIKQVQVSRTILPAGSDGGFLTLKFVNPVTELQLLVLNFRNIDANVLSPAQVQDYFNYSNSGVTSTALYFNNETVFGRETTDSTYMGILEVLDKRDNTAFSASNASSNVFTYSFASRPDVNSKPSGHVNMSRIEQQVLEINLTPDLQYQKQVSVYAINYNILRIQYGFGGLMFNSALG